MAEKGYSGAADSGGNLTLTVEPTTGRGWLVGQVTVEMPAAPAGARCEIRRNGYLVTPTRPRGGVSSGPPFVRLLIGDQLTITWAAGAAAAGAVGRALVLYEVIP